MEFYFPKIFFLILFPVFLQAQVDTTVLSADQLLLQDIQPSKTAEINQEIFAATRSLKKLKELPFTIYVITKEEIRDNGYRTLVDALKMQPGIQISQPGSALEGELFMMRGLVGNSYTKILLNGHPIKPSIVKGMPIGAQLPIQQAERIEIIYGAMGTLYGADASAGIINIVLEETKRPVYTQANLSVGSNQYTNLDVSFGGRLGKRKNTLRYGLFGSYTFRSDLNIQHDNDSIFDAEKYFTGVLSIDDIENYVTDRNNKPLTNDFPHQSRMVGVNLAYRAMKLSAEVMYRRDHSSIGLNPIAVSYSNPLNYTGEQIIDVNFLLQKDYRRFGFEFGLSYLQYRMDNRSSTNYIYNSTSALLDVLTLTDNIDINTGNINYTRYDSLTKNHFNTYFNGTRFSYSESYDAVGDLVFNFFPTKNIDIKVGLSAKGYASVPLVNYSQVPLESSFFKSREAPSDEKLSPLKSEEVDGFQLYAFTQFYWSLKRMTIVGGGQWYRDEEILYFSFFEDNFNPSLRNRLDYRLGINYQLGGKWSARAYYGTAVRRPSAFFNSATYGISLEDEKPIYVFPHEIKMENTKTYEVGLRWIPSINKSLDFVGFYSETANFLEYNIQVAEDSITGLPDFYAHGYYNSNRSRVWYGMQTNFLSRSKVFDFGFNLTLSYGVKKEGKKIHPTTIRKTRIVFRPTKRISFTFDGIFNSRYWNYVKFTLIEIPKFRTLDVLINYNINRNFRMFFKLRNSFNKEYSGLNASGTFDDLIYNPQEKRTFRLGMSYRI